MSIVRMFMVMRMVVIMMSGFGGVMLAVVRTAVSVGRRAFDMFVMLLMFLMLLDLGRLNDLHQVGARALDDLALDALAIAAAA